MNVVIPESIVGRVTVRLVHAPWDRVVKEILASHGLWYRYRAGGQILRVAPRKQLDAEFDAARGR